MAVEVDMRIWIMLLLVAGLVACGTPREATRAAARKPFITETVIDVPEQALAARLVTFDRLGSAGEGVMARYTLGELAEAPLDLFIYPAGRMPSDEALRLGTEAFLASVAHAEEQGVYGDVVVEEPVPFAATWQDGAELPARRIALRMTDRGGALVSRTWLTYKQNYWFKLRATTHSGAAALLDREGDAIARDLFARAEAVSRGSCSDATITLDRAALDDEATVVDALLEAAAALRKGGCINSGFPKPDSGFRRTRLPFPADAWVGGGEPG